MPCRLTPLVPGVQSGSLALYRQLCMQTSSITTSGVGRTTKNSPYLHELAHVFYATHLHWTRTAVVSAAMLISMFA